MKQVIYPTPESNTVSFAEVEKKQFPILGFLIGETAKVFLLAENYKSSNYFARAMQGFEKGNLYNPCGKNTKSIKEWCDFFVKAHKAEIFLFDSSKELFKWLSE